MFIYSKRLKLLQNFIKNNWISHANIFLVSKHLSIESSNDNQEFVGGETLDPTNYNTSDIQLMDESDKE